MAGAFSVHGPDEQIFGLNEQILVRPDQRRPKNNSRVLQSGAVHSSAAERKFVFTLRTVAAAEVVHDGLTLNVEAEPHQIS
jgi:hypothetical protein